MTYFCKNKDWIFSGIGIAIFTGLISLVKFIAKQFTLWVQLRKTPPEEFSYAFGRDKFWPEFDIAEPDKEFLLNCSIKTHSLLLKKLKKSIRSCDALIWLDVDRFSQINKYFGKKCGDEIIHTILMIIATIVKEFNLNAKVFHADKRDEFYVIVKHNKADEYTARIFITAIQRYDWSSLVPNLFVTCSAGVASYNNNPIDTLKRARASLNLIKAKGGNGIGPQIFELHPYSSIRLGPS